jgi:hypothetical protein
MWVNDETHRALIGKRSIAMHGMQLSRQVPAPAKPRGAQQLALYDPGCPEDAALLLAAVQELAPKRGQRAEKCHAGLWR